MNRRNFLKAIGVGAVAIVVPEIILPPEPEQRFWALGGLPESDRIILGDHRYDVFLWSEAPGGLSGDSDVADFSKFMKQNYRNAHAQLNHALLHGYDSTWDDFISGNVKVRIERQ